MGVSKMSLPRVRQARNEAIPEVIADPSSLIPFAIVGPHSEGPYSRRRQVPLRISRMTQETETAIREFCQQYSGPDTIINQVRNNLAILSTLIKAATEQGKKNSESADRLAASLNRLTGWLVIVAADTEAQ
jgi:hypothetical protein